jgi:NAD(P)-dependent dehydrogenase (short-subunit alcohol dehydrogenase family)
MGKALEGRIALVTGATRAAGRGIAVQLGAAGATVYVTGRTTRSHRSEMNRPETIEETAELVNQAGGRGNLSAASRQNKLASTSSSTTSGAPPRSSGTRRSGSPTSTTTTVANRSVARFSLATAWEDERWVWLGGRDHC